MAKRELKTFLIYLVAKSKISAFSLTQTLSQRPSEGLLDHEPHHAPVVMVGEEIRSVIKALNGGMGWWHRLPRMPRPADGISSLHAQDTDFVATNLDPGRQGGRTIGPPCFPRLQDVLSPLISHARDRGTQGLRDEWKQAQAPHELTWTHPPLTSRTGASPFPLNGGGGTQRLESDAV